MEKQELNNIPAQGEGTSIEFKEVQNGLPATLYDTATLILNRKVGTVLLGINDAGITLGLRQQNLMRLKQDIVTALNEHLNNNLITNTMTSANDPNKNYVITERGRSFLGGGAV